jgi:hypothetical protein
MSVSKPAAADDVAAYVKASAVASGVPLKIKDKGVLRLIAAMLR